MKIKRYILSAIACLPLVAGCSSLSYNEATVIDENWVYENQKDGVKRLVSDVYAQIYNEFKSNFDGAIKASATDEADFASSLSDVHKFYNGGWSAANPFPDTWKNSYRAIAQIHAYLERADKVDLSEYEYTNEDENLLLQFGYYPYELRFLRAYFYFELAKTYGDVPLVLSTLSNEEANHVTRTPVQDVFRFIVNECDLVAEYLPANHRDEPGQEVGRATRAAAKALKARALLYAASPLFNQAGDKELWLEAAQAAKEVIDLAPSWGIALSPYADLWGDKAHMNSEIILGVKRSESNDFEKDNYPVGVEGGNSGNCPTQSLVDAYEYQATGKTFGETHPGEVNVTAAKPYDGLDPRFALTIVKNGDEWPSNGAQKLVIESYLGGFNGAPKFNATPTGYYLKKYVDGSCVTTPNNSSKRRHTWIVFRLSEMYLDYAEAMFAYYGDADAKGSLGMSANEAVNVLRSRDDIQMPLFSGSDNFQERYRRERMVELAFEDHRFWDVRRWKIGATAFTGVEGAQLTQENGSLILRRKDLGRRWDEKYNLFPVPQSEIQKNPALTQNTGW
jgi:hypothetical protein